MLFVLVSLPPFRLARVRRGPRFTLRTVAAVPGIAVASPVLGPPIRFEALSPLLAAVLVGACCAVGLIALFPHGAPASVGRSESVGRSKSRRPSVSSSLRVRRMSADCDSARCRAVAPKAPVSHSARKASRETKSKLVSTAEQNQPQGATIGGHAARFGIPRRRGRRTWDPCNPAGPARECWTVSLVTD
ncbi:hypothetical protein CSE45_4977 [Citreicella sp. SE45]|nr:hypothetical protein CSE45_4977 [Citreicella sp. SE45]